MTTATTQVPKEQRKFEEHPFEFILYINNKIICQRFFSIRDYNEESLESLELKEMIDSICGINNGEFGELGILPNFLKEKSNDYLWNNYNPYSVSQSQEVRSAYEKEDDFQFEVRVDKKTIVKTIFSGNFFPPKVRYAVDIREITPSIISEIRYFLSQESYNKVTI
jgi:hypothetical protein